LERLILAEHHNISKMTGTVAQIVALISHGNNYLENGPPDPDVFSRNSAFQFCNRVEFWDAGYPRRFFPPRSKLVSTGPTEWFEYLRLSGANHLSFKYVHSAEEGVRDYMMAGFVGGGGEWLIEERVGDQRIEWGSHWELADENDSEKKIWRVSYRARRTPRSIEVHAASLDSSRERLERALKKITRFAIANNLGWVEHFEGALKALSSESPESGFFHQDLLVPGRYSREQRQLFYSAGRAWCFGGMGWWNDVWLESDNLRIQHEQTSAELFEAINQSIAAVLN
jgi:hypothetical protein